VTVFALKHLDRMTGDFRRLGRLVDFLDRPLENGGVDIAEPLDFRDRHAFLDELLLQFGYLGCRHAAEVGFEFAADFIDGLAVMQLLDQGFELVAALPAVVDQFTHLFISFRV